MHVYVKPQIYVKQFSPEKNWLVQVSSLFSFFFSCYQVPYHLDKSPPMLDHALKSTFAFTFACLYLLPFKAHPSANKRLLSIRSQELCHMGSAVPLTPYSAAFLTQALGDGRLHSNFTCSLKQSPISTGL